MLQVPGERLSNRDGSKRTLGRRIRNRLARNRLAAAVAVGAAAVTLAACSPLSAGEIAAEPTEPWACDGVSRGTIDLIIGEGYTVTQLGEWTDLENDPFTCEVNGISGHVVVRIEQQPAGDDGTAGADQLSSWFNSGGQPIENTVGATGEGYVLGTPGDLVIAGWVCERRTVEVELDTVWLDGTRDQIDDATRLMQQLLPYACNNVVVPGVDYSPDDEEG
ncbi:MAG: hypothetical protein ACTH31_14705 [Pseudoclavibacter sp.]